MALHSRAQEDLEPGSLTHGDVARIVVTGSESTGKTTLARELAQALGVPWVPEYSRDYAEARGGVLSAADVEPIARGQVAREDEVIASIAPEQRLLVLDTDLVSTTVYAEHYYGSSPVWIMAEARQRLGGLYLLAATDIPWSADGVRDRPGERAELHRRFAGRLQELGATVAEVEGLGSLRLERALAAVRAWQALRAR